MPDGNTRNGRIWVPIVITSMVWIAAFFTWYGATNERLTTIQTTIAEAHELGQTVSNNALRIEALEEQFQEFRDEVRTNQKDILNKLDVIADR